ALQRFIARRGCTACAASRARAIMTAAATHGASDLAHACSPSARASRARSCRASRAPAIMMMLNTFRREIGMAARAHSRMIAALHRSALLLAALSAWPCVVRAAPEDPYGNGDGHWGVREVRGAGLTVNESASLTANAAVGAKSLTVSDSTLFEA